MNPNGREVKWLPLCRGLVPSGSLEPSGTVFYKVSPKMKSKKNFGKTVPEGSREPPPYVKICHFCHFLPLFYKVLYISLYVSSASNASHSLVDNSFFTMNTFFFLSS